MGGHDLKHPDIPDWRIYKVEDVPELVQVKKRLDAQGLRYPWLRNEVWKYKKHPIARSFFQTFKFVLCGGFKYGLAAAIVTIIAEKSYMAYIDDLVEKEHGAHH